MRKKILSIAFVALLASVSLGQSVNIIYTPESGDMEFLSNAGPVTTFELKSAAGLFTTVPQPALSGLFDVNTEFKKFKLEPSGFDSLSLPGALQTGLSCDVLVADLTLDGSFAAGGPLNSVPLLICVPEASSLVMIGLGLLGFLGVRRN